MFLQHPMLRIWIWSSRCVTTPLAKCVPIGPVSLRQRIGVMRTLLKLRVMMINALRHFGKLCI